MENKFQLSIEDIRKFLPHRQPFLLVDRILEIEPKGEMVEFEPGPQNIGTRVVGIKNISYNEPCFQGHFPDYAIFPGVLIVEAMAQVASFSLYPFFSKDVGRMSRDLQCILVGVDGARFRRPVTPGDTLRIESKVVRCRGRLFSFAVEVTVDGQKVAEAEILANLLLKDKSAS